MKYLIFLYMVTLSTAINSQENKTVPNIFLRIYDLNGEKISKGKLFSITETNLILKRNKKTIDIQVNDIGLIKTKRSIGNNVLIGSSIGASPLVISGVTGGEIDGYAGIGGALFTGTGALVGLITSAFKNSTTFIIDGDKVKWEVFTQTMYGLVK